MSLLTPKPDGHAIKLVRDSTADIINPSRSPGDLFYGPADPDTLVRWLKAKLGEEVVEYLLDGGADELLDVYAVVRALGRHHGFDLEDLEAGLRQDPRGGFFEGVMMYGWHREFDGRPRA